MATEPVAAASDIPVAFADLPMEVLRCIAVHLPKPSRALLGLALTAPSSSWRDRNGRGKLSAASEVIFRSLPRPPLPSFVAMEAHCRRAVEAKLDEYHIKYDEVAVRISEICPIAQTCACEVVIVSNAKLSPAEHVDNALNELVPKDITRNIHEVTGRSMSRMDWNGEKCMRMYERTEEEQALASLPREAERLWGHLDFRQLGKRVARMLTDDDMRAILLSIDALNVLKVLKLRGCTKITGTGLDALTGSVVLEEVDLSIGNYPVNLPNVPYLISEEIALPILESIGRADGMRLQTIALPNAWTRGSGPGEPDKLELPAESPPRSRKYPTE